MTVRVDTLDALIARSPRRTNTLTRSLSTAVAERLATWWKQRRALSMSDEWLQEYRWHHRDRDTY